MSEPIPVAVASDANFFHGLQTTVASTLVHEKSNRLSFHILDTGLFDWQWQSLASTVNKLNPRTGLTRHRLSPSDLAKFFISREITATTYARFFLPKLIPDPYIVYIDSDFLVSKPVSGILSCLNSGKAVYGSPDQGLSWKHDCPWPEKNIDMTNYIYINAGFLLFNLEKWRRDKIAENLLPVLEKESSHFNYHDQTAINWLLKDDIDYLPLAWNRMFTLYDTEAVRPKPGEVNLHYCTGMKPWRRPLPSLSHQIWWLFNKRFPSASRPPNPLWRPRNLARYMKYWGQARFHKRAESQDGAGSLEAWAAYWQEFRK